MPAPRPAASREVFLDAALKIADESGPDALTNRALAALTDLDATTIYGYFRGKDVLLGSLFDHVVGQVVRECADLAGSPKDRLRVIATEYRAAFLRHPNVARLNSYLADMLASGHGKAQNTAALTRITIDALSDLGLSGWQLVQAYQLLETFVVGAMLFESGAQSRGMTVRALRYRALELDGLDAESIDAERVSDMSARMFWRGFDHLMNGIDELLVS